MPKIYLKDVSVWTPTHEEIWSGNVASRHLHDISMTNYKQWESIKVAKEYNGFIPSSGLWHRVKARIELENIETRKIYALNEFEDTCIVIAFLKQLGKYADGLVIQYPYVNPTERDFERDSQRIPVAKQIWQMAVPINSGYIHQMPVECDNFLNLLYGIPDAKQQLNGREYHIDIIPFGERRIYFTAYTIGGSLGVSTNIVATRPPTAKLLHVHSRIFEGGEDSIKDIDTRKPFQT